MSQPRNGSAMAPVGPNRRPGAPVDKNLDADLVLETIVCGLHWSAFHIGTLSHLVNACFQRKADWTLRPWRHILTDNSKIMQLTLKYCVDIGLSEELGDEIVKLYDRHSRAKALTSPLASSANSYTSGERDALGQLEVKWRQLSLNAIQILHDIKPEVKRRLARQYFEDGRTLVRFLMEAANGESKCVNAEGEISLPALIQRRQAPRVQVQRPCRLVLPNTSMPALLFDVSRDGVGVICNYEFAERQAVSVELEDGRLLKAIVVRLNGDRKGLSLLRPLPSDDPLFQKRVDAGY